MVDMEWMRTVVATAENPIVGDLHLDNGNFVWSNDLLDRVAQSLAGRLVFFRGTWYLDLSEGIPYLENLLGVKGVSQSIWRSVFTRVLLKTPGIAVVDSMLVRPSVDTREIFLDFVARLDTGKRFTSADSGPFRVVLGNDG